VHWHNQVLARFPFSPQALSIRRNSYHGIPRSLQTIRKSTGSTVPVPEEAVGRFKHDISASSLDTCSLSYLFWTAFGYKDSCPSEKLNNFVQIFQQHSAIGSVSHGPTARLHCRWQSGTHDSTEAYHSCQKVRTCVDEIQCRLSTQYSLRCNIDRQTDRAWNLPETLASSPFLILWMMLSTRVLPFHV